MVSRTEKNKATISKVERKNTFDKHKEKFSKVFKVVFIVFAIISSFLLYARYVATFGIVVREYSIVSDKLPEEYHGLKIVHISDIHYGSTTFKKELNNLEKKVAVLKPDILIFTGDLIDKDYECTDNDINAITEVLSKMNSTIGKFAVDGNQDDEKYEDIMKKSGFTLLNNTSNLIYKSANNPIYINGIDSSLNNKADIKSTFEKSNKGIFTITLMHETSSIDTILDEYDVDIILAGHSRNGQIKLPLIGPIFRSNGSKKYFDDYYKVKNTDIYISGGIGTNEIPLRLFNRPSINLYRLRSH